MTDNELKELVASLAIAQQKTDIQMAKTDAQIAKIMAKTDAQMAKTDAQMAKTDIKIAKTDAQMAKTDIKIAKLTEQQEKTDAKLDRIANLVGNISNNQGDVAEEFFYRSFIANPYLGTIHFDIVYRNIPAYRDKIQDEFDIVLVNEKSVAIIEVKQKAHPNLIDKMLSKKIPNFKMLFPCYAKQKIYAAIASLVSNEDLLTKAKQAGLFLLTQDGKHSLLVNDKIKTF
ncbi:hypothetical protein QUF50_03555 [Thiotrichales bacterium HSG1]|nr:hypothetical protein [Thiotrichales bacterium HSG1]